MQKRKLELKTLSKFAIPWTLFLLVFTMLFGEFLNPFISFKHKWFDFKFSSPLLVGIFYPEIGFKSGIYASPSEKINIVAIDEFTTEKYGWPFKRRYYADLITKLNKYNVKVIGFDVMFMDPDRDNPENDRILIEALSRNRNIINLAIIENMKVVMPLKGIVKNSPYLANPNAGSGMDSDGKIRRMFPFFPPLFDEDGNEKHFKYDQLIEKGAVKCLGCEGSGIPLLGLAAYGLYKDISLSELNNHWYGKSFSLKFRYPELRYKHLGRSKEAKTEDNAYSSPYMHISIRDILEDKLSKEEKDNLAGGIALVGATATGAFDHFPSPFQPLCPGVEFHATLIDNMIKNDFLRPISPIWGFLILILCVWFPIFLQPKSIKAITLWSFSLALFLSLLSSISIRYNYDMDFAVYFIALMVSYIYIMAYKSIVEGREKRWIKSTFSQYLSPKVVDIITEDPSKLTLGGEKRDMTVFFMDIAGFTGMSEKMSPEELTKLLNLYLSELTEIIHKHDGVVDKYIGDCIMAFWNAPIDQVKHRTMACKAAIDCIEKLREINAKSEVGGNISVRIGINSGPMVVGNMGSNTRFSYTVLGDNVNLASRLEGSNKFFHSTIMVSADVYEEAKAEVFFRFLGNIRVVGKAKPVAVYEPLSLLKNKEKFNKDFITNYEKGIEYFHKKEYEKASDMFKLAIKENPSDGPSKFYEEFCKEIFNNKTEFDGVFNMTAK